MMSKKVLNVFMEKIDQMYSHEKYIDERTGEKQAKKRKHTDHKSYRAVTYCLQSLRTKDELKIKKQIEKYCSIESKNLNKISGCSITSFGESSKITILTKYNSKTLKSSMRSQQKALNRFEIFNSMRQLALGVKQLHQNELTHNRISLGKIQINNNRCVLGLPFFSSIEHLQKRQGILNLQKEREIQEGIYLAPELFEGWYCSQASDVWALGVTFLQIVSGKIIQKQKSNTREFNILTQWIEKNQNEGIRQLLKGMLHINREQRININEVLNFLQFNNEPKSLLKQQKMLSFTLTNMFPICNSNNEKSLLNFSNQNFESLPSRENGLSCFRFSSKETWSQSNLLISVQLVPGREVRVIKAISDFNLEQTAKQKVEQVANIIQLLKKDKFNLKITQCGEIMGEVSQEQLTQIKENKPKPSKLQRAQRCMATVINQRGEVVQGLLIGQKLILTSASFADSQQNIGGILTVSCKTKGTVTQNISALSYYFFDQYIEKKPNEPNCTVIEMDESIYRLRYMTVVSNYSAEQTGRKLRDMKKKVHFHYQAGGHEVFIPNQLIFLPDKKFRVRSLLSDKIKKGCPLLVVFSHNQCYAIGMFESAQEGYLFGDSFYWFIWNCVMKNLNNDNCGAHRGSTKMMEWQNVQLDQLEPIYSHVFSPFPAVENIFDYLLEGTPAELKRVCEQLVLLRARNQLSRNFNLESELRASQKIIELYQKLYGKESEVISVEYFLQTVMTCNRQMSINSSNIEGLIQKLDRASEAEGKYKRNMGIYIDSWLKIINFFNASNSVGFISNSLEIKVFEGLIKLGEVAEYFDAKNVAEDYNYMMMTHCLQVQNNKVRGEMYCQKFLGAIKGDSSKEARLMWQASALSRGIGNYGKALKYLKSSFEALKRLTSSKSESRQQIQQKKTNIMNQWKMFNVVILSNNSLDRKIVDEFIELTQRFVPQQASQIVQMIQASRFGNYAV